MAIRASILCTFGIIFVVIGLVLTIYGHMAGGRPCTNCVDEDNERIPDFNTDHDSDHINGDRGYDDVHTTGYGYEQIPNQNTAPGLSNTAVKYAKVCGPIGFGLGIVLLALAIIYNRRLRLKESADIQDKWNGNVHYHQRHQAHQIHQEQQYLHQINNTTPYWKSQDTQTRVQFADEPRARIVEPPPAYEDMNSGGSPIEKKVPDELSIPVYTSYPPLNKQMPKSSPNSNLRPLQLQPPTQELAQPESPQSVNSFSNLLMK